MRILLKMSYNGKDFHGFQYQHNYRTVQGVIEAALTKMHKRQMRIHPASRTDRGVHALEQYCHFDTDLTLTVDKWHYILNRNLPADISINEVAEIPEYFHVRYHSKGKTYRYSIYTADTVNPFFYGLKTHYPHELDKERMLAAMQPFLGTHDFTSFSSAKAEIVNKVRTITEFRIEETEAGFDFIISGSGFLYNMVRIIVAYIVEVGAGRREPETEAIIRQKDRTIVPRTAPAEGLYLEKVHFDGAFEK
ncbi:tRNA pseudouridine(38-40) synthase TruA [Salinicoccus halitifaciens]|uniref:tRNA pseudouridine synthase A n=1 Tax=Salinicoccus halitifaciens TaxID=1073415 RepID=A0ABV2EB82_9STAP|nr:tRNA pseudouridine(38-40) synthase TruA [Salinicoccus halitifaciens]MCD2138414.1 tRNA pseudouridine(38-40) synthase TruA [Salinicoccus halitifaciens]